MARDLTAGMATEVAAASLTPILLVEFLFDSGPLRLWSGYRDLPWNSVTWTGNGDLLAVSEVVETAETTAQGMTFTLSGVNAAILSLVEGEDCQNRVARLYLGALDSGGAVIADPYEARRLLMSHMEDVDDGAGVTVVLFCEDVLADFERPVERRYTNQDQHLDYPDDDFFEFVPDLQEREIVGEL